jgi:hypothetical protein
MIKQFVIWCVKDVVPTTTGIVFSMDPSIQVSVQPVASIWCGRFTSIKMPLTVTKTTLNAIVIWSTFHCQLVLGVVSTIFFCSHKIEFYKLKICFLVTGVDCYYPQCPDFDVCPEMKCKYCSCCYHIECIFRPLQTMGDCPACKKRLEIGDYW